MTDFNKEFHTLAREIRLTEAERSRVLAALRAASVPRAVPSPFFANVFAMRLSFAFAALVIIIGGGAGAAYASQSALPGDVLYPVKVAVTEPLEGALATTPDAKAQWNANVAATRLDEASALAKKGELTASTSAELAANFNAHADALSSGDARFAALAEKAGNVLAAGKESGNATSTLASGRLVLAISLTRAHTSATMKAAPMAKMMSAPADESAPAEAEPMFAPAETPQPTTLMAPMMMKASFAPAAPPDDDTLAETLSVEAHGALDDATTTAATLSPLPDGISSKISDLSALVVKAEAERVVGSTTDAIADFEESLRRAAELELLMNGNAAWDAHTSSDDAASSDGMPKSAYPI